MKRLNRARKKKGGEEGTSRITDWVSGEWECEWSGWSVEWGEWEWWWMEEWGWWSGREWEGVRRGVMWESEGE